jgi:hypothetical protein
LDSVKAGPVMPKPTRESKILSGGFLPAGTLALPALEAEPLTDARPLQSCAKAHLSS